MKHLLNIDAKYNRKDGQRIFWSALTDFCNS